MPRHKIITAGYLLLERDGKYLLLRRYNTGYRDGEYSLIAGHGDPGESLRQCVMREVFEEAGIEVLADHVELVHVLSHMGEDGEDRVDFFWRCTVWSGEVVNKEPEKCDDLAWFPKNALPKNLVPELKVALEGMAKNQRYSEYGY